jgi:uncharacterized protein (TIGR03067 family)
MACNLGCGSDGTDTPKEDLVNEEIRKLEGTWICVSMEVGGQKIPEDKVKKQGTKMVIKGDRWTLGDNEDSGEMTCKIDPSKKPKALDTKEEKGKTSLAIYELKGDRLKLCDAGHADRERPTDFVTEAGTPQTLFIFERAKP